jgi:hypothetical protein
LISAVVVRSYSRMIGQTSLERKTNSCGATRAAIAITSASCAGLR